MFYKIYALHINKYKTICFSKTICFIFVPTKTNNKTKFMKTYIILEDQKRTSSKVIAENENKALLKAIELNKKHEMYTGVLSVVEAKF